MSTKIEHYENGNIKSISVKNKKGQFHNENGPAVQGWQEKVGIRMVKKNIDVIT